MRIAIVTGASSGLGREFVRQLEHFYRDLDEIWVVARRKERLEQLKKESGIYVRVFAGDMRKPLVYKQVKNRLENQNPDVRMLVNAAGFGRMGTVEEIAKQEPDIQPCMIDVNCRGLTEMTCVCLPWMSGGSRILNVASAAAFCPQSGFAVYAATKSYVLSFSRALGQELSGRRIVVTAVCPGPVNTEFFRVSGTLGNHMKESVMADAAPVVRQALLDAKAKKPVSVFGTAMKGAEAAAKILPHSAVMKAMEKISTTRQR